MTSKLYDIRKVPFQTADGLTLDVTNIRGAKPPTKSPVLLVHGAGVRGNIFNAPVETTVIDALLAEGFDVWLENWRASIDFRLHDWTLDQAAFFDHPEAVKTVLHETGAQTIKAIIHCQGSTSFTMSALAGLVPQVETIVSNAVSLHPIVPRWSRVKLRLAVPVLARLMRSMNPGWGDDTPAGLPRLLGWLTKAAHHECDNTACQLVSFTYGAGRPALWEHENLNDETHDTFIQAEFGHVPLSFFRHIRACEAAGHLISLETYGTLPEDYAAAPPKTDARWVFFAGEENKCFLPDSQQASFEWFDGHAPGKHALHWLPGYSHLDVFMGKNAATDVFPKMIAALG
ncbi:esterase [Pacificoceanicola onchidii]|uniref:esterase n=1 Tax=Pacificoceanicola onchidii TaxID=2562685 RepID=UPI0010A5CB54|nr:esterase [Pacificoceanicola onchidii]